MDDRSTDIFGPVEDNNDENVEEEEEWMKRSLKRNRKKMRIL